MPETDIDSAVASDLTNAVTVFNVASETTDAPQGDKEYEFIIEDWEVNLGYYKSIPELQTAIDAKSNWVVGAGFEADNATTLLLDTIKGNGKDSFNSILRNAQTVKTLAGDSFAEIIRDKKELLINLKPLDPSSMKIVSNGKGRIIRYEQINKVKEVVKTFQPEEIFHLSRNRIADEVHGISIVPSIQKIIDARAEAMADWKTVLHRHVSPLIIWHLDTDDTAEIATFKKTNDKAIANQENMYIPKGAVEPEIVATATNATLNPLASIEQLNDNFYQVVNVPQIIVGNAKAFTDASGKIVYLAYEQSVKGEQLYMEEQILSQLNIEINLTFPASLQQDTISDTPSEMDQVEEEPIEEAAQPNDTTEELEGPT